MNNVLPHPLTTISTTQVVPLGYVFRGEFGLYVFVYNFGADSFVIGDVVSIATTNTRGYVTNTAATVESASLQPEPPRPKATVLPLAASTNQYCALLNGPPTGWPPSRKS